MITATSDQAGGTPRVISGEEQFQWSKLVQTLDLKDTFRRREVILKFSWDNKRLALLLAQQGSNQHDLSDGGRILKRLDRIYADRSLLQNSYTSQILSGSELNDHLPVIATFHLGQPTQHGKSSYRMNVAALRDPRLKGNLEQLWPQWQRKYDDSGTPPLHALKACLKRATKYVQLWGKKTAQKRKEKQNRLAVKILQESPATPQQQQAVEQLLATVEAQVSFPERVELQKDFSELELHIATKRLGKNKCPGPDGIPVEFFLTLWTTIAPLLLRATTEGLQTRQLIPFFNKGVITLLHKDGDTTLLKNKRPITLLSAV
ncbi:hypothetical protein R1sor_024134 [Riccia sorocarpa]|uniref:Reverse transcriptase n=1 Tax=Riccia sorocarpa TaxID=122646 RepID=A0ABD3GPR7_9MARC